ncbi:hypothetical protein BDE02_14G081300 [Populus trichocarpa]|nr:hypothetical protein BDE02_14G081300 [Populus trichocarpa]
MKNAVSGLCNLCFTFVFSLSCSFLGGKEQVVYLNFKIMQVIVGYDDRVSYFNTG